MAATSSLGRGGEALGGRYELRQPIGSGGMATVWLAEDIRLGRPVAVKLLSEGLAEDSAFAARFRREARIAAGLAHPNLVSVYDFEAGHPGPYLVMEYVPGLNLAQRLERGELPQPERLAGDLLSALGAIHRAGVVHRDVKPQNVLVAPDGRAVLTDFGIARPEDATSITQTGQMPGTARYMAPELMRGEPASPVSDLYSSGVLLRECFDARPAPAHLTRLAGRLAEPEPEDRPASAVEALADLRRGRSPAAATDPAAEVRGPEAVRARSLPRLSLTGRRLDRSRAAVLGGLALACLAVVLIAISTGGDDSGGGGRGLVLKAGSGAKSGGSGAKGSEQGGAKDRPAGDAAEPPPRKAEADPARGEALNKQGYSLLQSGRVDEAIPVLQRAVASFPEGTGDLNYAYSLFNLAHALREAGRPEEAIPLLRERLGFPDQTETVRRELDAAIAEAGGPD